MFTKTVKQILSKKQAFLSKMDKRDSFYLEDIAENIKSAQKFLKKRLAILLFLQYTSITKTIKEVVSSN